MSNDTVNPAAPGADLSERLREAEKLLSEVLKLHVHLARTIHFRFLTGGHEARIRKFLCLLPREDPSARSAGDTPPSTPPSGDASIPDHIWSIARQKAEDVEVDMRTIDNQSDRVNKAASYLAYFWLHNNPKHTEVTALQAEFREVSAQSERNRQKALAAQEQAQLVGAAKDAEITELRQKLGMDEISEADYEDGEPGAEGSLDPLTLKIERLEGIAKASQELAQATAELISARHASRYWLQKAAMDRAKAALAAYHKAVEVKP